jgi:hypothetical protein
MTIPIRDWKEEKSTKKAIWFKILLGSVITTRNHHKEDLMVVMRLW